MFALPAIVLLSTLATWADNVPMLFDLEATCLGSTGHSAMLEVSWSPIQTLTLPKDPQLQEEVVSSSYYTYTGSSFTDTDSAGPQPQPQPQPQQHADDPLSSSYYTYYGSSFTTSSAADAKSKLLGTIQLIGEFSHLHLQHSRPVHLADNSTHFEVPSWALETHCFSSLLLKQGGVVVGRLEFVEWGALCGHNDRHEGDVDGGAHLPDIPIV